MQEARSDLNGVIYTALQIEALPEGRRQVVRSELRCENCGEPAHYRSRSSNGRRRPHFFCRPHLESCAYISIAGDPWGDDDEGRINAVSERGGKLILKIEGLDSSGEQSGSGVKESDDGEGGGRTRRIGSTSREQRNVSRGPQRILELLVGSPAFRTSTCLVKFRDSSELPIHRAFVIFQQANSQIHTDHWHGFWGRLSSPSRWAYGSANYFNFGGRDSDFRVSVSDSVAAQVLQKYGLESVEQLTRGWFMLFDIARISNSGRFTSDIISPHHVGFVPDARGAL